MQGHRDEQISIYYRALITGHDAYLSMMRRYSMCIAIDDVRGSIAADPTQRLQQLLILFPTSRHVQSAHYLTVHLALNDKYQFFIIISSHQQ